MGFLHSLPGASLEGRFFPEFMEVRVVAGIELPGCQFRHP